MDVDGLRNELEKQLAKNPDAHAPQGFRDRFDAEVARYESSESDVPKSAREAELQRIHDEAEAAATAAGAPRAEEAEALMSAVVEPGQAEAPEPRAAAAEPAAEAVAAPVNPPPPAEPVAAPATGPAEAHAELPAAGGSMTYALALVGIAAVLAAAYYFFRH